MFSWFKKKDETGVYSPDEKKIFTYWNGERQVKADPLFLHKKYSEKRAELAKDLILAKSMHSDADKGMISAMEKIRYIFSIKTPQELAEPWLDKSLTIDELMDLFAKFMVYIETLKKNSKTSQITSMPMVDLPSSLENAQPTSSSVDSGSTPNAWSINAPEPLPTVSVSPLETLSQVKSTGSQSQEVNSTPSL